MYFRLDTSRVEHTELQYGISDYLGDIGGIAELLIKISSFLLGGYLSFNSSIEIMKELYSHSHEDYEGGESQHEDGEKAANKGSESEYEGGGKDNQSGGKDKQGDEKAKEIAPKETGADEDKKKERRRSSLWG